MFQAHWSACVQDEWTRAVLRDRPELPRAQIERTRRLLEEMIEDANVSGYEHLIENVTLPDPDDRHVLAAAIHCEARIIVTANLRDFPAETLSFFRVEAQHPDVFIIGLFNADPSGVLGAVHELRASLKNPPFTVNALLADLARNGLPATAEALAPFLDAL